MNDMRKLIEAVDFDYDEAAYQTAIQTIAEQIVAMVQEDYSDREEQLHFADEYAGDAHTDVMSAIDRIFREK